jgi:hypothetical protein
MYINLDMLTDPMFWLPLPVFVFFLGGRLSPLSSTRWYRLFWESIGFNPIQSSDDMLDVPNVDWSDPCGDCSTDMELVFHAVETHHIR